MTKADTQTREEAATAQPSGEMLVVGKLGSPYGVRGWLALQSFTEPSDNLLSYEPWYMQVGKDAPWIPVSSVQARPHKDAYIAQINGLEDRDEAQALTGALIGVRRDAIQVPEEDEYLWHDLIGCLVTNVQGLDIGVVKELMETGAHAVLCITPSQSWIDATSKPSQPADKTGDKAGDKDGVDGAEEALEPKTPSKKTPASVLVPFNQEYVQQVDIEAKQVVVNWQADWS